MVVQKYPNDAITTRNDRTNNVIGLTADIKHFNFGALVKVIPSTAVATLKHSVILNDNFANKEAVIYINGVIVNFLNQFLL